MIVVIDTNFIVELVLQQEQAEDCRRILALCDSSESHLLAIPAFSIAEAMMKIERRQKERKSFLSTDLKTQWRDLQRSTPSQTIADRLSEIELDIAKANNEEAVYLAAFVDDCFQSMTTIPLTAGALTEAREVRAAATLEPLSVPDGIVLGTVLQFLRNQRTAGVNQDACFITRDKNFVNSARRPLQELNCRIIFSFNDAVSLLQSRS